MKVLVFTDLHLHRWSDFAKATDDGGNTRLKDGLSVFKKVGDLAVKEDVQRVVFLGDLFHRRGLIDTFVFNEAFYALSALAERLGQYGVEIVILPGNHDQATRVADRSATSVYSFSAIPQVSVVMSPIVAGEESDLGFIPFIEDVDGVRKAFKLLRKCNVIFFHGGLDGAATGALEYRPKEELDPSELPTKPLILCGHYHKRQQLKPNVWYVGSPMQHVRGDAADTKKGCVIVDTKTKKLRWFNWTYPQFVVRRYPDVEGIAGNFVDVLYDADTVQTADVHEKYKSAAHALLTPEVIVNDKSSRKRIDVHAALDYDVLMTKYVDKFGKKLKHEKLMKLGRELLGRAP